MNMMKIPVTSSVLMRTCLCRLRRLCRDENVKQAFYTQHVSVLATKYRLVQSWKNKYTTLTINSNSHYFWEHNPTAHKITCGFLRSNRFRTFLTFDIQIGSEPLSFSRSANLLIHVTSAIHRLPFSATTTEHWWKKT